MESPASWLFGRLLRCVAFGPQLSIRLLKKKIEFLGRNGSFRWLLREILLPTFQEIVGVTDNNNNFCTMLILWLQAGKQWRPEGKLHLLNPLHYLSFPYPHTIYRKQIPFSVKPPSAGVTPLLPQTFALESKFGADDDRIWVSSALAVTFQGKRNKFPQFVWRCYCCGAYCLHWLLRTPPPFLYAVWRRPKFVAASTQDGY